MLTPLTFDRFDQLHDEQMLDEGCPNCVDLRRRIIPTSVVALAAPFVLPAHGLSSRRRPAMSDLPMNGIRTAQRVLGHSLLQYVSQCEPWHAPAQDGLIESLKTYSDWQQTHCGWLELLIDSRRSQPDADFWPEHFATYNFCNMDYLLPKLIEDQSSLVATLDECLLNADSDTEARTLMDDIVAEEHQILERLREESTGNLAHRPEATTFHHRTTHQFASV
jgi:hypothetical protein